MMNRSIVQEIPLKVAGSSVFGRYQKINAEKTFNMILSDKWLVPYPGHIRAASIISNGKGRGIYVSRNFNHMILVIDNNVYTVNSNLFINQVGTINTYTGEVYMDENNAGQIAISDQTQIWVFDYVNNSFTLAFTPDNPDGDDIDFSPGYISFQDGYLISPSTENDEWRLSEINDATEWPRDSSHVGKFQSKPNHCQAAIRMPGGGNLLCLLGTVGGEFWYDIGSDLFPYQRSNFVNLDYGTANAATVAVNDEAMCWIGQNEKSGLTLFASAGGHPASIATDGINFKLDEVQHPTDSCAFMFKQAGHVFYQFTFIRDNFTLLYDLTAKMFYNVSDEYMNYHPARRVGYFNNTYYFISINDGHLYEMNNKYTTYNGTTIPRVRVCNTTRASNNKYFVGNYVTFPVEQGEEEGRIDVSVSKNGGETFSSYVGKEMNRKGKRVNRFNYQGLGAANEMTMQFRFLSQGRIVVGNGTMGIYQ